MSKATKSTTAIASNVEYQILQLERARAVLHEGVQYFENIIEPNSIEAGNLIRNLDQIVMLFHVADDLLFNMLPELKAASDALYELKGGSE